MSLTIRLLESAEDLKGLEAVQMVVWHMPDPGDVVPRHQLQTAAKYGGIVLGAYDEHGLVGFCYGFIGLYQRSPMLCSHMLAVLPRGRGQGVGVALKVEQRRVALERGIRLMHWTYDPLELLNANLNIRRLGGISRTYARNLYGAMQDGLNAGLPSDRVVVEWHLDTPRVAEALSDGGLRQPALSECVTYDGTGPVPAGRPPLAVPLTGEFQAIKRSDPALALQWRLRARAAFEGAFAADYVLTGVDGHTYLFTHPEGGARA